MFGKIRGLVDSIKALKAVFKYRSDLDQLGCDVRVCEECNWGDQTGYVDWCEYHRNRLGEIFDAIEEEIDGDNDS